MEASDYCGREKGEEKVTKKLGYCLKCDDVKEHGTLKPDEKRHIYAICAVCGCKRFWKPLRKAAV